MFSGIVSLSLSSALWLTAMAANPMGAEIAKRFGVEMGFGSWLLAASVPTIAAHGADAARALPDHRARADLDARGAGGRAPGARPARTARAATRTSCWSRSPAWCRSGHRPRRWDWTRRPSRFSASAACWRRAC